jgi:hypothetical protein
MKKITLFLTQKECDAISKKLNANGKEVELEIMKIIGKHVNSKQESANNGEKLEGK